MSAENKLSHESGVVCSDCEACCCRLEVLLITETGVPERYVATDSRGGRTMARLDDGWCSALDRNTMKCMIYAQRPLICREFEVGDYDCTAERDQWKRDQSFQPPRLT